MPCIGAGDEGSKRTAPMIFRWHCKRLQLIKRPVSSLMRAFPATAVL